MRRLIGQSDDMYTMQCKDGCKIDVHVEGRAADGEVFLQNSTYTNLSVGGGVLPEAVESALELVRQGQAASFAVKVPLPHPHVKKIARPAVLVDCSGKHTRQNHAML